MAYGHGESPYYCCFHPREVVVGVCAHCLRDRLLLCLKQQQQQQQQQGLRRRRTTTSSSSSTSSISLPKVFALGSSFLQRLDSRHHHHASDDGTTSAASLDDSFISIKFEDNGKATWDTHTKAAEEAAAAEAPPAVLQVVEHAAAAAAKRGRWRKQVVGRLLQLARWKRPAADGNKHAAAAKARAGRPGWIRSLTRRRAAAAATAHGDRPWS